MKNGRSGSKHGGDMDRCPAYWISCACASVRN